MLYNLHIENIAIINSTDISFDKGFCVLTGETGAGKSILIDSVNLLTGERSNKELVRSGCDKAFVEGTLYDCPKELYGLLEENGIPFDQNDPIILSRELSKDGRTMVRINGRTATTGLLKTLCASLINIHGQHDSQSILNSSCHIDFLDAFSNTENIISEYRELYKQANTIKQELDSLNESISLKEQKQEILSYQLNEIKSANLSVGEEEELKDARTRYLNFENIITSANECYSYLYGNEEVSGAFDLMESALSSLYNLSKFDKNAPVSYEKLNDLKYEMEDAVEFIRTLKDETEDDGIDINEIESRLDLISRLKRKYGNSIEEILETANSLQQELFDIENSDYKTEQLKKKLKEIEEKLNEKAELLTEKRQKSALKLEQAVMNELSDLDMENTKVSVMITPCEYNLKGKDKVEFLIAPNKGEELKPLTKIASGGELSRIILAIKVILAEADKVSTLIFDEVDTGVSGGAAQKIAEKLRTLSKHKQVFVITHLPQVAVFADSHYKIEKTEKDDKTFSTVNKLDDDTRVTEIARMLSGTVITKSSMETAKEMLNMAKK